MSEDLLDEAIGPWLRAGFIDLFVAEFKLEKYGRHRFYFFQQALEKIAKAYLIGKRIIEKNDVDVFDLAKNVAITSICLLLIIIQKEASGITLVKNAQRVNIPNGIYCWSLIRYLKKQDILCKSPITLERSLELTKQRVNMFLVALMRET